MSFLLFAGDNYYPGGFEDFIGEYDTEFAAKAALGGRSAEWAHVVETGTWERVAWWLKPYELLDVTKASNDRSRNSFERENQTLRNRNNERAGWHPR